MTRLLVSRSAIEHPSKATPPIDIASTSQLDLQAEQEIEACRGTPFLHALHIASLVP